MAVLGVGLIGGSIGLAARTRADAEVCGYDLDEEVSARALRRGAIQHQATDLPSALAGAEIVFVAAPVGALADTVRRALESAPADCVITDVGSTKRILAAAGADERFVGGHPLAGAETSGVDNAREDLFDGATWYLTPAKGSTAGVLYERLHRVLRSFGARPTAIDPDTHDRLMASVSHLPHVLANLLAAQASSLLDGGEGPQRLPAIGPSFRDATRVAGANSAIWTDIYLANRDALIGGIDDLAGRLAKVRASLLDGDASALGEWIERARVDHEALLGEGAVGGALRELRAAVPNRPGVIAEIALALGGAGVNIFDMALSPSEDNSQGEVALWIRGEEHAEQARALIAELGFPVVQP